MTGTHKDHTSLKETHLQRDQDKDIGAQRRKAFFSTGGPLGSLEGVVLGSGLDPKYKSSASQQPRDK